MTYQQFFEQTDLEKCLLVGYYGGGNFGDELLLEVLLNVLYQRQVRQVAFVYRNQAKLHDWHATFPYRVIGSLPGMLLGMLRSRSIIVGGGGLWGMDVNFNILLLSLLLWLARHVLGKEVYLLGVGYYGSTGRLGRFSARLAAKSANLIIARDDETLHNFQKLSPEVSLDTDLAFLLPKLDLTTYDKAAKRLAAGLHLGHDMVYVTLRQFHDDRAAAYHRALESAIAKHSQVTWLVSLLQPVSDYPAGQVLLERWARHYPNVQLLKTDVNPLVLVRFFQQHAAQFRFITPQFHAIVTAIICHIPYAPIVYDNKVQQLLNRQGHAHTINLMDITPGDLDEFLTKSGN